MGRGGARPEAFDELVAAAAGRAGRGHGGRRGRVVPPRLRRRAGEPRHRGGRWRSSPPRSPRPSAPGCARRCATSPPPPAPCSTRPPTSTSCARASPSTACPRRPAVAAVGGAGPAPGDDARGPAHGRQGGPRRDAAVLRAHGGDHHRHPPRRRAARLRRRDPARGLRPRPRGGGRPALPRGRAGVHGPGHPRPRTREHRRGGGRHRRALRRRPGRLAHGGRLGRRRRHHQLRDRHPAGRRVPRVHVPAGREDA